LRRPSSTGFVGPYRLLAETSVYDLLQLAEGAGIDNTFTVIAEGAGIDNTFTVIF